MENTIHEMATFQATAAAQEFISVMKNEIASHGAGGNYSNGNLGPTAVSALSKLDCDAAVKKAKNLYTIDVNFTGNLHRDSLAPDEYDGVDNIAALLNNGYSAGHTVYGIWMGHYPYNIASIKNRDGTHFIDNAVRTFMTNYATKFGVDSIEIDDIYK